MPMVQTLALHPSFEDQRWGQLIAGLLDQKTVTLCSGAVAEHDT